MLQAQRARNAFALTVEKACPTVKSTSARPPPQKPMTPKPFKRFIGIDLGGGKGKKTALAVLDRCKGGVTVTALRPRSDESPLYDGALFAAVRDLGEGAMVCVDAPLTLPPCIPCRVAVCPGQDRCVDPEVVTLRRLSACPVRNVASLRGKPGVTPYTQRATEAYLLHRRGIPPREALGQGMGPLTARACHLVRALANRFILNENLIEVFPRATLELLGFRDPYKKRVDKRIEILAKLRDLSFGPGVWREECRQSDHVFDAVISAYTGYLRDRDGWTVSSEIESLFPGAGWIWIPPADTDAAVLAAVE
jgi:predicted nuclease with RNAse H fold